MTSKSKRDAHLKTKLQALILCSNYCWKIFGIWASKKCDNQVVLLFCQFSVFLWFRWLYGPGPVGVLLVSALFLLLLHRCRCLVITQWKEKICLRDSSWRPLPLVLLLRPASCCGAAPGHQASHHSPACTLLFGCIYKHTLTFPDTHATAYLHVSYDFVAYFSLYILKYFVSPDTGSVSPLLCSSEEVDGWITTRVQTNILLRVLLLSLQPMCHKYLSMYLLSCLFPAACIHRTKKWVKGVDPDVDTDIRNWSAKYTVWQSELHVDYYQQGLL